MNDVQQPQDFSPYFMDEITLRNRLASKWKQYGTDTLPAFVAEMDFTIAEPIQEAIERTVRTQDYGYPMRNGMTAHDHLSAAFVNRMQQAFAWTVEQPLAMPVAELVQAIYACVQVFAGPGEGVVIQSPAYPPIRNAVKDTGRRLIAQPMVDDGERYGWDIEALEQQIDPETRIILFCNPHNPTGRVFGRDELLAIGQLAIRHDLVLVSDEIHADLVYEGSIHIPIASLSPEIAARTVTITSATKSFNIPGLRAGIMYFGSAELRKRFEAAIHTKVMGAVNTIGIDATVAAWNDGQPWLDRLMAHLTASRDKVFSVISEQLPELIMRKPEATYLGWVDCSALRLNTPAFQFFHDQAGIAFSPGENFDETCRQFVRFNFATSTPILDEILHRFVTAASSVRKV